MEKRITKKKREKVFLEVDTQFGTIGGDMERPVYPRELEPSQYMDKTKRTTQNIIQACSLNSEDWDVNLLFHIMTCQLKSLINDQSRKSKMSLDIYKKFVDSLQVKWKAISNKMHGEGLPESLWNAYYASNICLIGEALYPGNFKKREKGENQDGEKS